jgi:chromosomal replication initiation ATPase DnaA
MQHTKPIIGNVLVTAEFEGLSGNSAMLIVSNAFELEGIKRNQPLIEEKLTKAYGRSLNIRVTIGARKNPPAAAAPEEIVADPEPEEAPAPTYQVQGELMDPKKDLPPGLDKIVNKFPGRITKKK